MIEKALANHMDLYAYWVAYLKNFPERDPKKS